MGDRADKARLTRLVALSATSSATARNFSVLSCGYQVVLVDTGLRLVGGNGHDGKLVYLTNSASSVIAVPVMPESFSYSR